MCPKELWLRLQCLPSMCYTCICIIVFWMITVDQEIFTVKLISQMPLITKIFHAKFVAQQIIRATNINYGSEYVYIFLHIH